MEVVDNTEGIKEHFSDKTRDLDLGDNCIWRWRQKKKSLRLKTKRSIFRMGAVGLGIQQVWTFFCVVFILAVSSKKHLASWKEKIKCVKARLGKRGEEEGVSCKWGKDLVKFGDTRASAVKVDGKIQIYMLLEGLKDESLLSEGSRGILTPLTGARRENQCKPCLPPLSMGRSKSH